MFDDADNFADIFRGGLPYCLLIALPILILCTPAALASDLQVQRMAQFDINGVSLGCRASAISLEAKSLYTWSTGRHCVLARLLDISVNDFNKIRQKAGGLIVLLPNNLLALSDEAKEQVNALEQAMLTQAVPVPVYFSAPNKYLEQIVDDITHTIDDNGSKKQNDTAIAQLFLSISANGYQVTVSGANAVANKNSKISVIQGELLSNQYVPKRMEGTDDYNNLPVILITANLKTFGIYNDYPLNADAAILMGLIELFSKLHSVISTTPKYRLVFLLSESGVLLNFQGSKKWLDDNVVLQNVEFVLCLDTITQSLAYNQQNVMYMHVSKPPKEKSSISNFFKLLKLAAGEHVENVTVEGVHKKINLADTQLAWEHERFSMKRYPAFTLSSVKNPRSPMRTSMFKDNEARIISQTLTSAKIIAEALASYIYNIDQYAGIFDGHIEINEEIIQPYLGVKSVLQNSDIKDGFEKYLKNVKIIYDKPDAREPDFMFYEGHDAKLNVYRVKPAVFDLFLTFVIALYLSIVYFVIQYFPKFYDVVSKFTKAEPSTQLNGNYSERVKTKVN
ncbi:nicalin [Scaptodrosophila lebanonensis]|uniref:Nicalin n=1 Tax=Drosophila lebanonensis TaxID=7225 RepID=A0A6J2TX69_DROLE|nr:nicalin [Scaptodrosophila lebanonensis]